MTEHKQGIITSLVYDKNFLQVDVFSENKVFIGFFSLDRYDSLTTGDKVDIVVYNGIVEGLRLRRDNKCYNYTY